MGLPDPKLLIDTRGQGKIKDFLLTEDFPDVRGISELQKYMEDDDGFISVLDDFGPSFGNLRLVVVKSENAVLRFVKNTDHDIHIKGAAFIQLHEEMMDGLVDIQVGTTAADKTLVDVRVYGVIPPE